MQVFFSDQKIEWKPNWPSIFLAGPTPRDPAVVSWRMEALRLLNNLNFNGIVLVPERHNWDIKFDYIDQVEWELDGLYGSSCVAFWIPRDMKFLHGLCTNVEFGALVSNKAENSRIVYGRPDDSCNNRYLDWFYSHYTGQKLYHTLEETLRCAIATAVSLKSLGDFTGERHVQSDRHS